MQEEMVNAYSYNTEYTFKIFSQHQKPSAPTLFQNPSMVISADKNG